MDPASEVHPITYTNSQGFKNRKRVILILVILLFLISLAGALFFVNNLLLLKSLKLSCIWSPDSVSENSLKRNFTIPENSTLPANKSKTIGVLIESKYPVLAVGKIAVFYSSLDKSRRIWSQLLFSENNNQLDSWMWRVTPFQKNYLYYLNYSDTSVLTKEGYYHFVLINNKKVFAGTTCVVADKVLETDKVKPKSNILKYVK